jgi:hypothetical protein
VDIGFFFSGLFFLVAGVAGSLWVGRRKFYRRNAAGVERFKSYGGAVAANLIEKIVVAVSAVSVMAGALVVMFYFLFR